MILTIPKPRGNCKIFLALLLPHHHSIDGVGLEVAPVGSACILRSPILVIRGQASDAPHFGLQRSVQALRPAMASVWTGARRDCFTGRGLGRASAVTAILALAGTTKVKRMRSSDESVVR